MILKVKQNENPYDVIGNYIEKHIPVIDDVIAVISTDGKIRNELFLVDGEIGSTNNCVWQIDWWEGEENVELIDFFFVSDACKNNNNYDLISREQAIEAIETEKIKHGNYLTSSYVGYEMAEKVVKQLQPIQPEPHWIPVTKDLPKESGHYIVTTRTVCLPINLLHPELDRYSNNVRIDYFRAYDNKFDLPSTVAWWSEPLPEPYEGVTE